MGNCLQEAQKREATSRKSASESYGPLQISTRSEYWIAVVTFAAGFGAMTVLSLKARTFSLVRPTVKFPLTALPSVLLGDSVLLPMFNVRLLRFTKSYVARHAVGKPTLYPVFAALAVSVLANLYLHRMWIPNQSTVFTNVEPGGLSSTGVWHFGFCTAETWLVLLFLWAWGKCFKDHDRVLLTLGLETWVVILYFSLLSFADFAVRNFYVAQVSSLLQAIRFDHFFLLLPATVFIVYVSGYRACRTR